MGDPHMTPEERAALVERLKAEWHFFRERLASWEAEHMSEEGSREWDGHVAPPLARLDAKIARLSAEVERLKGQDWPPIETAPRGGWFLVGVWVGHRWSCWVVEGGDDFGEDGEFGDKPTHWHPLPTPPASQDGRADG